MPSSDVETGAGSNNVLVQPAAADAGAAFVLESKDTYLPCIYCARGWKKEEDDRDVM